MFSLFKRWYIRHFSQPGTIEFALVLFTSFIVIYYFMWLVGPIVVALCIAYCLDWPVDALVKRAGLSRHAASILVMTLFCSLCVFITVLIVPLVVKQGVELYDTIIKLNHPVAQNISYDNYNKRVNQILKNPRSWSDEYQGEMSHIPLSAIESHFQPFAIQGGAPLSSNLPNLAELAENPELTKDLNQNNAQISTTDNVSTETFDDSLANPVDTNIYNLADSWSYQIAENSTFKLSGSDFDLNVAHEIHAFVDKLPEPITNWLTIEYLENFVYNARISTTNKIVNLIKTQIAPSVVNAFTWLMYLIIVPIFTFLMLYNKQELKHRFKTFVLPNNQSLMQEFWPSMHSQIAGYIRGKIIHIIIISIANTLAFMMMGVNYSLLLGVGVGLSVVIPYVGAVIIAIPVILVAIFQFSFSSTLLWVLVVYVVIQLLDSNVLTPALFSKALNLDAFSILSAILIFGGLWGFWGVFFAIPLATFIKTLIVRWPSLDALPEDGRVNPLTLGQESKQEQKPTASTSEHHVGTTICSYLDKLKSHSQSKEQDKKSKNNPSDRI